MRIFDIYTNNLYHFRQKIKFKEVTMTRTIFAGLKEELSKKHPNGATYEDINTFCDEHPVLRHPQARMDFNAYILCAGE
ncbi:MAG: hypothetical protein A2V96_00235 [Candidatus Yonathbacteria bacterium RBG_16_43_6]|nr:MAG: hypothetical protein A2V96_00235 [Candidatus Yonathbacteria bacterium RBG_16_43_6]